MKQSLLKSIALCFIMGSLVMMTACSDDDDPDIDTGGGGILVSDGLYVSAVGSDPSSTAALNAETVEDDGFASQDRSGFVGGYMWLDAGDYQVVQVTNKEITSTIGSSASETVTDMGSACDLNDYQVFTTAEGGSAINVATSGLYRVTHDQTLSELVVYPIASPGLIGDATPNGWSDDTPLAEVSRDAMGATWEQEGVVLREGQWKIRFNCRWSIDRRIDPNAGFDMANGYQLFTNFGGSATDLLPGNDGANIEQTMSGTYTVTVNWDPRAGWSVNLLRTGDAPTLTFDPNDYKFAVIGDATANGWDDAPGKDRDLLYKFDRDTHWWGGVITMADMGAFKLRTNDSWDFNLGNPALTLDGGPVAMDKGGDNIPTPGAGAYYVKVYTGDEGDTWYAEARSAGWGLIGEGSPSGNWDNDTFLTSEGFDMGVSTFTHTGDFGTGPWKFRAGGEWTINIGENLSPLIQDGGNIMLGEAGTYKITLTYNGADYTATAEKQ